MIDISGLHSFGLRARAKEVIEITDDISGFDFSKPHYVLGEGTNTVFVEDFDGAIVLMGSKGISISETAHDYIIEVAAGENWHSLVIALSRKGIHGLENLALIPGTLGAAPIQNIGAYGVEFSTFCQSVEAIDRITNERHQFSVRECAFGYRDSVFKQEAGARWVVLKVTLALPKRWQPRNDYGPLQQLGDSPTAEAILAQVISVRQSKLPDPLVTGNAGSFFKNPIIGKEEFDALLDQYPNLPHYSVDELSVKIPAAFLIDSLGFKGQRVAGAGCHHQQPLVLVNHGNATAENVLELARDIQHSVKHAFGIHLENEVRLVGKNGLIAL